MEVTLKTEVEAGASGFSVMGGGNEGIFIKKVLKESPASKIFSLREGDQLLSATIFFDNIKYEDALKILQYSEPYRVQFSLKRKIAGKEELAHIHSTAQYKKERLSQEKELSESIPEETLHVSGKDISEEDRETLIVSQRVGRSKRPKKDRLSWPKFQSIKNKKILGHRRSHSTSDAYEPAIQDVSPTSTDTESQFQQEVHIKEKKGSQKKLKFPSIGFKMHRSKTETQDKQKKEIKTTLLSEREKIHKEDISLENPEILTVEYTTSPAYEIKTGEAHETLTKGLKDMKNGIPSHTKKCPEVEISTKKEKDKESTTKITVPEVPAITTQISKPSLETPDLKESPTKQTPQASSKSRKKKQKATASKAEGESGVNVDMTGQTAQGSIKVKGLEIGTAKAELHTTPDTVETGEKQAEDDKQILTIQKTKFEISMTKTKEPETEKAELGSDVPHAVQEKKADTSSEDGSNLDVKPHVPNAESEISTWKIQMPSFKMTKTAKADMKISSEERIVESVDSVKKAETEEDGMPSSDKKIDIGIKIGEKDMEGKESKFRLPKLKLPTFTWANTKEETGQNESQVSDRDKKVPWEGTALEAGTKPAISVSPSEMKIPCAEIEIEMTRENINDKDIKHQLEGQVPVLNNLTVKTSSKENNLKKKGEILITKADTEIKPSEVCISSKEIDEISQKVMATGEGPVLGLKTDVPGAKTEGAGWKVEKPSLKMPKADIKAPKVDISLPSVNVTLPKASVDLQAPEAALTLEGEAKAPEKEVAKTKDGKFKMPKFGMPSFGWSSSREAKGTVAADVDVSLKEPQVTAPSGSAEVDVTLPTAEIQAPSVEVTVETASGGEGEKGRFKMPDVKMPSVKLPKVKAPHVQVGLPKAEGSLPKAQAEAPEGELSLQGPDAEGGLEAAGGKVEGAGMKIHMPKVKVPSVVFSKPTVKAPKVDADVSLHKVDASLPEADLKASAGAVSIAAPDIKLPSVEGSLELQAPDVDLKVPSGEGSLDGAELEAAGLKGKFKMPKFDKPKFGVSPPKAEGLEGEVSLPTAEVGLPSATVTAAGEGPALGLKADVPGAKTEGAGWKVEKPSLKMPKADIKAPKVDISLPSVNVTLPKASVDLQAPEAALTLEGEAKAPEKEVAKTKDGKFKMPKFGMPSFGWSSSREAKGTVAADVDVSLKEPQVTAPSGSAEVDVTLPTAEIQAPSVEVTVETAAGGEGEKGRFKMPDVKMPSVKLPKVKAPHVQVGLPKAEGSLPKAQAEAPEGELSLQGPDAEGGLEAAGGKVEGAGMKIHMPKVKVPSVVFSKPTVKAPKVDADVSLHKVDASLPEADLKASAGAVSIAAPDIKLPSVEGSLELQAPDVDLKVPSGEGSLDGAELEAAGLKGKFKMPKFDKPKFGVSPPKAEGLEGEVSLPTAEVGLPSATVTAAGEGPALGLKADVPGAKTEGAGWKVEKPSLKMPKADIKAPKVDISLPSVDVTLPKASVDLQAPEAALTLEGESKAPEKEVAKTKDGKFKMPKFGMPSFGWSSSREAKGTVAADVDVSLKEPQVTAPLGSAEVDVTLPTAEIQAPSVEVTVETAAGGEGEKGRFKMPDVKMPSVKLPKVKAPHVQVGLPKAEGSLPKAQAEAPEGELSLQGPDAEGGLEAAGGKVEGAGMKIHMPKVKVPSVVFSKPTVKAPKVDADVSLHKVDTSLPEADLKASAGAVSIAAPDIKLPSVEGSLELQAPDVDLKVPSGEGSLDGAELEAAGLKGKFKMPKFDKPKFGVSPPKAEGLEGEVSLPTAEVGLPSATVTAAGEGPALGLKADVPGAKTEGAGWKVEKPSLKMPKADIKAPKVNISLLSVDVTLPKASVDLQAPEAALTLEGEAKAPEKEVAKTKDGKFKMPKFGMPSFGWSSSREAKGTVAADVDVSLKEPQVTAPLGSAEVDVTLPTAEIQAPSVEVTVETAAGGEGEKGRFKMPDVKMPSVKLPKVKAPHVQVGLPKAEGSLPKAQAEAPEGELSLQGPDAEGGLEAAGGKVEGAGMKIHMPKVKVPSVVFSKPTVKAPKVDADVSLHKVDASLPETDLKASAGAVSIAAPDIKLPSVEGSLELQAPDVDLKVPSGEGSLDGAELEAAGLKGKFKMPKFDKPKFGVSPPKAEGLEGEVSLPTAEVGLPSATVTAAGEGPALGLKADVPGAKTEGAGWKVEKPSLKMPKADIKAPKVDISLPSVDVTLPKASVDLQAPEAALTLEGEAKAPEKEVAKTKDGKFKMPKFGMPSFGWSSSREAKGTVAADVDVSLKEPQVTAPSGSAEVDVTLPTAEIQAPSVEVTVETAAGGEGEKGRFKMPDVKMPSVKLPKVKPPHVQVGLPKAEGSLPKAQAEAPEGELSLQGPDAEGGLEAAGGKVEGAGMKIHMPKVKVPSVVFSKPTVKAPKVDADVSLHKVDASLPEADLKASAGAVSIAAPDIKLPSVEGSLELQAPDVDLKVPCGEGSLDGAKLEAAGLKGKFKMPKFDKPKFGVSPPKAEGLEGEVSLPTAEVGLPSVTVTAAGEGPALGLKADVPGAKTEGAGWKVEKPSLKMPKADIKAPKVDISLPSVDVTLPKASVDLQAPEAALTLEGESKAPEKEVAKTKDGKFKMPKFGMPSFGWSSSREAKGTVAADVDVSLKEPQVTAPLGSAEVDVTLPTAEIQAPSVEVTVETAAGGEGEKGRFKMPDVKMPSVKLPKVKAPHVQVGLPKAEGSLPKAQAEAPEGELSLQGPDAEGGLEAAGGKVEGAGMKIHMPKVKVPSVVFSKPTVKAPKVDADVSLHKVDASLPEADLKASAGAVSIAAPDIKLPSVEGSLELQAPDVDLKVPSGEGSLDGAELEAAGLKGKFKMPKFDKPKFGVSPPKAEGLEGEVSLPTAEVGLPSATVTAAGEGPALGLKADVPGAKTEGAGWKVEKPSLKMPKADIKAPKVDISLPSVDVTLPKASVDLQVPEAALTLEGEAKAPEKEVAKTKDGKFKMPKFGMPSFGWSSSREAKGTVAADVDVSLKEPQVTAPSGSAEVDVTLPTAEIQAPSVEVTVETAAGGEGEKGRFKMPDVKMPSVKLPKVKAPHVQVGLPKAEGSLPKAQAEAPEGELSLQGPDAEGGLEAAGGKVEGAGMKIHMPKVKVPSVVFSKPTVKAPKVDADVSLHKVDASLPEADLKASAGAVSIAAPDIKLPSVEGSLELQAPDVDLKVPSGEGSLDGAELEAAGLKGKFKMPKFDKPKFGVSPPKAEGLEGEVSLPTAEVGLPSATVTAAGEGPALGLKADVPGAKTEGAGWKVEKPSLKMPKADIKAPKVDISLPSVDVTLPKASVDLQAPEAALTLEGESKAPEKEVAKTKDGKFKMPKFGMPSFGWSSSREAKGTVAADVDVSLKEPQVTAPSGSAEVDVTLPTAEIQAPSVEVTVETAAGGEGEKGRFKMPDVKMPSVKLPKVKAPHVQVGLPKAEGSLPKAQAEAPEGELSLQGPDAEGGLEAAGGKVEGAGMKIHMPKVKVPSVVFSKPTVKAPKVDADVSLHKVDASLPEADLKASAGAVSIAAPDIKLPSVEGSLELQAPDVDLKVPSGEGSLDGAELEAAGLKGKFKMPKFDKPKFGVSPPKAEGLEGEVSLPTAEVGLPSATVTAAGEGPALGLKADVPGAKTEGAGWKVEKPSLKMPKADIKAPKVDISLPSVDVTLPKASVDLQAPEAALTLEGESKAPEKEVAKTKDGKFKMPKFGMPSFGWSSSREAKGTVAADVDVSLKEPQVTALGSAEVDVTLPTAEIQAPSVEVTVETAAGGEGEKGRFKMPDVKMPSVKLPKVKAPHVQVGLPKAEGSLPKAQAEAPEGELSLQGPDAEGGLEAAGGKVEGAGMKIHMPKVKVPSVVFSKPTVKAPKVDADVSLHKVDASLPEADLKASAGAVSIAAPDIKLPSVEGSLELQAPDVDLKVPSGEGSLDGAELEAAGLKGKFKMPKFDKPKFGVSPPKAEGLEGEVSLPTAEVGLPSATVTAAGEGPALGLKADVPGAKTEGAGWKVEKPSLKMPKADIKAPKVDISLPSVDVTLPKASVDLQAPEAALTLEGEAKAPEKEVAKTKDGKFKMPKFGMPSFGWSSSREAKGTVAADVDVSLKEPQVTAPSGSAEVDVTLPTAEIQAPSVEVTVETAAGGEGEKGRFKMPDVKMPSVKLPKVKAPHVQVGLPKAEGSLPKAQAEAPEGELSLQGPDAEGGLEAAGGKVEGAGMKIHMPKVKVPSVVFSKPTVKAPKVDADVSLHKVDASLPEADLKASAGAVSIAAPDIKLPSVEGSLELQAPDVDLKVPSGEGSLDGAELEAAGLKGKFKMPKFDKPKFGVSPPKAEGLEGEVSLPTAEVGLPSATVTAAGEGPALGLKADVPGAKTEGAGWKVEKPSLKMPKADIKAPKVDISLPSVDVTLPKASVDLQAPEAALTLEGESSPEKEVAKTKDGKFKMPKFGMPSFGWSSSREAKGTVAADVDVSLKEPQVTAPLGSAEVDVTLPTAEIQVPSVEVTVETAAGGEGEKGRFKMPDVKMPSVKLPKVKAPHVQVGLPKAEGSLPKAQAEAPEGELSLQGPDAEGGLEAAGGKVEGAGMKIHMPKVKVPSVVFSKPTVKAPKVDADVSLHKVDASLPEADLKASAGAVSIAAPDIKLPSVEGSLELQAPDVDLKVPSGEGSLDGAELEAAGLKGKFKMPKFDKPKFGVSPPKAEGLEGEVSLPTAEVGLPSATVTAAGEGPALGLKADVPGAKTEGAGWKVEKPSLKMPKADIKAPKVDISLPSVDVTLPKASVDLQAPEAALTLEGEAKAPEKEVAKTKDGKFKMPKFGMPSFGWSSSREAKGTVAADVDVGLKEPQVTAPSGSAEVDVTLPTAEIQAPSVEVTVETAAGGEGEKGRFKMPDVKMPSVKLPKVKAPHVQVGLPKAEGSLPKAQAEAPEGELSLQGPDAEGCLEAAGGKVEGAGMKIHMPKVKVPSVVFSKPTVKAPKVDADVSLHKVDASLPEADLKASAGAVSIAAPDIKLPSVEGSLELQAPDVDLKVPSGEGSLDGAELEAAGLKGKFKMPKFDKPKFGVSPPKAEGLEGEVSLPTAEVGLPSATVTAAGEGPALGLKADVPGAKTEGAGWKVEKPSLKMPKADIKAPKVDISLPSVDVTLPKASVDLQAPEAALTLEGEAKAPEKEVAKTKDGKFKMPKFGMPSFGWSSSRDAKGTVAADVDVSLKEPQVTAPSGSAEVDVTLPTADIQPPDFEVIVDSSSGKEDGMGKAKSSLFRMPKVSLSKSSKPQAHSKSAVEVSVSETLCYSVTEETPAVLSSSVGSKHHADVKVDSASKNTKFRIPSLGFSKVDIGSSKIDQESPLPKGDVTLTKYQMNLSESESKTFLADENISDTDFEILNEDGSLEPESLKEAGRTPAADISVSDMEFTVKIPKFRKPKFGISWSKGKPSESDIGSKVESEISKGRITSDTADADIEKSTQIPDAELSVKMHKPSPEVVHQLDVSLPSVEVTMPKLEVEIHGPDLDCKAEQEVVLGEKDTEEKENKFKASKFKLPSFSWSPKKEAIAPSEAEGHLEERTLSTLSGGTESELTFPTSENHAEFDTSTEKDVEQGRNKKSQFIMPKISFPKMKGQKAQVSLPIPETDVCGPKQEKEGVSVQKSEKGSQGEGAGIGIEVPKVTVPNLEFSKPEIKGPKIEMDICMPKGEVILPTCEEDDLTLKSAAPNASLFTSDIKMITEGSIEVKSPDTSLERTSSEIAVGDVEIKIEGPEGKTKMSKFQMPKFGITHSKGKGSEKEVSQTKPEVKVPQLKAMVEIADIAVEAPNLEVECSTGIETYSPKVKMTKADHKASEADAHLPSADISVPKPDSNIQDSDATLKFKGEIKQDGDGEEKEGHFKMPKFKLPSFSWSPKKEASVKPDSGANLEDSKLAVMSGRIDTEVRGPATDDQGTGPALDLEISAGKVEQKSPIKKPQFVMPKISLSKIKVPKSQTHSPKVEIDATIPKTERQGDDSIQIPDIERSHSERTEEGAQISIKLGDVKIPTQEFSQIETGALQTEMGASSAKIDAALPPLEGSFQQVVLKSSSTDEDTIQKPGIKFLKGEASTELRSPEIVTERSSIVDGRKMKSEGPEGKIKMPKFQKPKFGISLTKEKGPETEISSPKIETELPQLKMTKEIADVAAGVPASELTSDMSDLGVGAYACKIKTPQVLTAGTEAPKVDISPQSLSKPMTEGALESLEGKEIKLKEEHEIKAEEVQTEEHQGWFKMPKFRIPAFGRTSLKEKKGDAGIESMEKTQAGIPFAKAQTETSIPENTFSLPHTVAEITIGKEGIPKLGDSMKSSDVSLPKVEGDITLSTERTDSRVNIPKTETYADIVKRGADGQKMHTSEFTVYSAELSKSYLSASETDKDNSLTNGFPTCTLTVQEHKVKSQDIAVPKVESSTKLETSELGCKPSSAEITLGATQEKIDVSLPKQELDIKNQEAVIKKGKIKGEMKIVGKDSEGSQLKGSTCEWPTTKGSEDGTYVTAKLEDLKVPGVKMDVKIARVDPEMKFQVKSVEKDKSAGVEVQVEDRAETSKIRTYKFKIPKFGLLHPEVKSFEDYSNLPKSEADSVSKTELGTAEMQFQTSEGYIGLESSALDHMEASARITVDKSQCGPEVNIKIPKLKIPRFTFKALPTEADVSVSKVLTDPKGSSTDIEVVQLQASPALPEETPETLEGGIQKAKSKILTLTEPDIKTAQMTTTIESSLSKAGQDLHWSYVEGQEVSEKVEPEHVAIERCEIYTTEILKESEILSSEVKTATLGFSLLKVKLPESHSNLEVLVQQPSPTEDVSVSKPKCADEGFGVAVQRTGSAELKPSDKPHSETEESSGEVSLPKLKTFAVEVKPSSKPEESLPDKSPEGITAGPLSKDEDVAEELEDEEKDITNEKDKTDNKRSPGRFKFWLPTIGFSSSGDETSTGPKPEVKKSVPEYVKPADTSDNDSSKQTEKTGWFRFPRLGFTSPSKKAKTVDKEETGHKEGRISDEDSPSDKPDVFFDAQESLSPKETTEDEKVAIDEASSNVPVSRTIVTSSARTELILLEEEKDSQSNIPGDTTK
ncbi:LOW QUALITY PROTEIN: protein AHNAK2 [Pluvialis apricaria]